MTYLVDTFTPDMLCISTFSLARFDIVDPTTIPTDVYSAISDANMTRVISGILGFELTKKSDNACISDDYDALYLARYHGPKLEEGAALPKEATITFYKITTKWQGCRSCSNFGGGDCCTCGWMQDD